MILNFNTITSKKTTDIRLFFIVIWVFSLLSVNLYFPYFLMLSLIILSAIEYLYGTVLGLLSLFFIFSFSLPYDFVYLTTGSKIGLIFNHYFFAGIPIYLGVIKLMTKGKLLQFISRSQKIVFLFIVMIFVLANLLPGLGSLLGVGGYTVRTAFVFNYLNGLLVFIIITSVQVSKSSIMVLLKTCSHVGLILAILAIVQFLFKTPTFFYFDILNPDYSRLFVYPLVDSIDGIMFLTLPLFYWQELYREKLNDLRALISYLFLLFSLFLSFSRWALFSYIVTMTIFTVFSGKNILRTLLKIIKMFVIMLVFLFLSFRMGLFNDQLSRLESDDNLLVRGYLWGLGITAIEKSPVVGYGLGNSTNAMFQSESNFNLLNEENSTKSVETFTQMGVHQFLIDSAISQGVVFSLILIFVSLYILFTLGPILKAKDQLIAIIFNTFLFLMIFWVQNNGSQYFIIFFIWGVVATLKYQNILNLN
jgi:hypothetical protein